LFRWPTINIVAKVLPPQIAACHCAEVAAAAAAAAATAATAGITRATTMIINAFY